MHTMVPGAAAGQAPMSMWNGALRFGLEIAALVGIAAGAAKAGWIVAVVVTVAAAAVWGVFRVPNDPGPATVPVRGILRLVIETVVLSGGVVGFAVAYGTVPTVVLAGFVAFHYIVAADRVRWLLER